MKGLVIKNTGSWYQILSEDNSIVDAKVKGRFRMKGLRTTNPVSVGDQVLIERNKEGQALITTILPRKNYIIRKSSNLSKEAQIIASNLDMSLLLITIKHPETTTVFIDRFLLTAQAYQVPTVLVFNKIDLYSAEDLAQMNYLKEVYSQLNYTCLSVSLEKNQGVDTLKKILKNKISLLSGHSGVGKSTLINTLMAEKTVKTGEISEYHKKGMHTTTFSEMHFLEEGARLIDTPGIKGFGTVDINPEEVSSYFPDIFHYSKKCYFNNCTHQHEPQCAVLEALEENKIAPFRYYSYLSILEDADAHKYR